MEFKKYSPDTIAELLIFLADHEKFNSLKGLSCFDSAEVRSVFYELSQNLKEIATSQPVMKKEAVKQSDLTDNVYKVISKLTPHEETVLFKSFKIS